MQMYHRYLSSVCRTAAIVGLALTPLFSSSAQTVGRGSVSRTIAASIEQQAALIQANAEQTKLAAEAHEAYAEALSALIDAASENLDLELKVARTYWDKKEIWQQGKWQKLENRLEQANAYMLLDRARETNVWKRAFQNPEKYRLAARSGKMLNRMMHRIDSESGLSSSTGLPTPENLRIESLDEETLNAINVQIYMAGGAVSASLTKSLSPLFERWPVLFRHPELRARRDKVTSVATQIYNGKLGDDEKFEAEQGYLAVMEELNETMYRIYPLQDRTKMEQRDRYRLRDAERFLQQADRTVINFIEQQENVSPERPVYIEEYPADQRNLITLCRFMLRHGLEFGEAGAGAEPIYDRLFREMKNLAVVTDSVPDAKWAHEALDD